MSAGLAAIGFVLGALDLGWAVLLVVQIATGTASAWLAWIVPLPIAVGLFIWSDLALRWHADRNSERAAGMLPTTLACPHAPNSFPAPARDHLHRSADLLARDDR
ncbi:hypothetical protein [Methylobacterium sp. E-066]|uniref:hypothetical protein n=1 Tax=Methylobacterium sp. E-066 TaxID=2836584 RepID=UPI001FB8C87F|nr:hypothetical protein [Methylobacterium sp. E-066]MCJ2143693.1 hypothetical protein [Methylobacterium sp. E-066]